MLKEIKLQKYDYEKKETVNLGTVSSYILGKCISDEELASLLETHLNDFSKGFESGKAVGEELCEIHRTLQRTAVLWAIGVICGLADQQYTDPRNNAAITAAKQIASMYAAGDLNCGMMM